MTREEAISELKTRYFSMSQCLQVEELHKANESIDLAIEALQTEPCEDCISRQAVLDILDRHTLSRMALYEIEDLPSVQPFINKPCVSEQACHEDKMKVLEKIRAEIEQNAYPIVHGVNNHELGMTLYGILQVIDKYMAESEDKE